MKDRFLDGQHSYRHVRSKATPFEGAFSRREGSVCTHRSPCTASQNRIRVALVQHVYGYHQSSY